MALLEPLADDVQLALEVVVGRDAVDRGRRRPGSIRGSTSRAPSPERRRCWSGRRASRGGAGPPLRRSRRRAPCACARGRGSREAKNSADAVVAGLGQADAERRAFAAEELVRDLDQEAGAVAGVRLAAAGAAMVQVFERGQPVVNDLVRALALEMDDEAHAAAVVLELGAVEPLRGRQTRMAHRRLPR